MKKILLLLSFSIFLSNVGRADEGMWLPLLLSQLNEAEMQSMGMQISAEDIDFSNEANERLSCVHDGGDIEIGFNAKFLIEMLSNLDTKEVTMMLSEPNKAGLLVPKDKADNEDILMLVMPVMLSE